MDPLTYVAGQIALQRQADLLRSAPVRRERKRRRLSFSLRRPQPLFVPACATC